MGVLAEGAVGSRGPRPFEKGTPPAPTAEFTHGFGQNRLRKTSSTIIFHDAEDCSCHVLTFQKAGHKAARAAQSYFCKKVVLRAFKKRLERNTLKMLPGGLWVI